MDMVSIIWQIGILSAILVFGIKIGLATGLSNLKKEICICYNHYLWFRSSII